MNEIHIWEGRWSSGDVLIADHKLLADNLIVVENGYGEGRYYLAGSVAKRYPLEDLKTKDGGTMRVRAVPLSELAKETLDV